MKSQYDLWCTVVQDLGQQCKVSTSRDIKTAAVRFEHEGLAFLAITLPAFCKGLQKALSNGRMDRSLIQGFAFQRGLPRFLGGFLDRVFDRDTGRLLDVPDIDCLFAIRQITLLMGKIEVPCSDARNDEAISAYIKCEQEVRRNDCTVTPEMHEQFRVTSLLLFGDVMAIMDKKIHDGSLIPKHGPGATADRLKGNLKFDQVEWTARLESIFPYGEYAIPNWRFNYLLDGVDFLEPGQERPVKVTLVPKTLKTPRVIAVEPTCMQYMQQAILGDLVPLLESQLTPAFEQIGFTDQSLNRNMAQQSSIDGSLATLDLSEASDRVSNQHVRLMTSHFKHFSEALDATRSRKADVPGRGVIRLAKYASMGSATCFPVEAMVFLTIVYIGLQKSHRRQFTENDVKSFRGKVRVYGDDIVIPREHLSCVIEELQAFGLKINIDKSFGTGKFRESCGGDYYDGTDVTPVRVRHSFPSSRKDGREVIAAVSLRNNLYKVGLWRSARWMDERLEPLLGGHYPVVAPTSPILGRESFLGYETQRMCLDLHRPLAKGWVSSPKLPASQASGEGSLLKCLVRHSAEPIADTRHLERSGRPDAVRIKLRWAASY